MKTQPDDEHFIPIMDCLECGEKDVPLSTVGPWVHPDRFDEEGKPIEIWISSCPKCDRVPLDESEIKGYVSMEELEEMGWKRE